MGFFGTLFGAPKAVEKVADTLTTGLTKGLDAAIFTKEEKTAAIMKMVTTLQDQYLPRALSRRYIAVLFSLVFCTVLLVSIVFACLGKTEVVKSVVELANAFSLGWIQMSIIVFYFGYYGFNKVKKGD